MLFGDDFAYLRTGGDQVFWVVRYVIKANHGADGTHGHYTGTDVGRDVIVVGGGAQRLRLVVQGLLHFTETPVPFCIVRRIDVLMGQAPQLCGREAIQYLYQRFLVQRYPDSASRQL